MIEKEKPIRTLEQEQQRQEKRKELRELLPVDLQLEFVQERPEKEKWEFEGELIKKRHSEIDEDKLFIEAIKSVKVKDIKTIDITKEKSKEKRKEISDNLNDFILFKQAMQKCFDEGWPDSAGKIAVALAGKDPESAKQAMQKCFDKGWPDSAGEIAVALNDKESAKQAMQKCFDEGRPGSAGEIAVALAGKDPESAKQAMQKCFDEGWPGSAGKIAVALNDKESAKQAMQKCFDEGRPDSAGKIAVALAKNFRPSNDSARLLKVINKTESEDYGQKTIANLLEKNQDLKLFKKEYLPKYLFIKKLAQEVNNNIEETKKWENPEEFFNKYNLDIVDLQSIDPNLSTQLLKNHIFRGLSFAESYINIFKPALGNKETTELIRKYIKTNKKLDGYNLSDLLEISSAYLNMNLEKELKKTIDSKAKNFQELKSELNKNLLKKVAENLNIKTTISEQEIFKWKIKYFANLITNQELIKKQGDEDAFKIYNSILTSVFEDRFNDFISNLDQKDEIGQEIAKHNQKVEQEFRERNIGWENWLNFKEQIVMTIGTQKKQDREALFNQFEQRFKQWQDEINKSEPRLKASLEKDLIQLTQKKKEFDPSKINLNDPKWTEQLLPTYTKSLNYLKIKYPDFKLSSETEESFGHLIEIIRSLTQEQQKEQTAKKEFNVKLWDRDPRKDMFQGNQTHCCIAVGVKETPPGGGMTTLHPETIFQYLIDKGVNVAEIVDPDTGDVVAQTWLFVTLDKDNRPTLVADNFEVNSRYPVGNNVNRGIRESMFEFLSKYAKECNIPRVVLGKVNTNDVETSDSKPTTLPSIKKLGGYFNDNEYYLETLNNNEAWEIKREVEEIERKYKIEIVGEIDKEILEGILEVERASFPEEMQDNESTIENLASSGTLAVLKKDDKIVGYVSSIPAINVDFVNPEHKREDCLYVWNISIKPEERGLKNFIQLATKFRGAAKEQGFKKLIMHARVNEGLSSVLQKRVNARFVKREENWSGFGEPFDYLEMEI